MTGKSVKAFQTASKTAVAVAEACMVLKLAESETKNILSSVLAEFYENKIDVDMQCKCENCGKAVSGDHVCQRVYLRVIQWRGR